MPEFSHKEGLLFLIFMILELFVQETNRNNYILIIYPDLMKDKRNLPWRINFVENNRSGTNICGF